MLTYFAFFLSVFMVAAFSSPSTADTLTTSTVVTDTLYLPAVVRSWPPTWEWQTAETVEGIGFSVQSIQTVIDGRGRLHLFWDAGISNHPAFVYHAYQGDDEWIDAQPVAESLGQSDLGQAPVLDAAGNMHLVWPNEIISGTQTAYRLLYSRFDGSAWSQEEEVYRSLRSVAGWPQIDAAQRLHLYVRDNVNNLVLRHGIQEDGDWAWTTPITFSTTVEWIWPDYADGVRGYDAASQDHTLYSRWRNNNAALQEQAIQGLNLTYRRTLLDGTDALHVFWSDLISIPGGTATAAQHQCLDNDLTLSPVQTPSGFASVGSVVADVDHSGWFGLGWATDNDVQLVLWNSCTSFSVTTAPAPLFQSTSLEAIAVNRATGKVCIVRKQFLHETREVVCAVLQ
jgi:hypothetical protein